MFAFLKSAKALEDDLREWLAIERVRRHPGSEAPELARQVLDLPLVLVLREAASAAMTLSGEIKSNRAMGAPAHGFAVAAHCARGLDRAKALADRKRWKLSFQGAPAVGYTCEVETEG